MKPTMLTLSITDLPVAILGPVQSALEEKGKSVVLLDATICALN